jgi:hypothetical protein
VSLLADLGAALPRHSYYFRDFSVAFYPWRLFLAREVRAGRWPFWNPYVFEGSFAPPLFYPPDLLHVLFPGPVGVSWLLTLHLPVAALCAHALARELDAGRLGAFVAGGAYALGGLALSSLNLYVFLQALALAPLVALAFLRAAGRGGRSVVGAGLALALALSTMAVEFVAQAVLLGLALGLLDPPRRARALRMLGALALGLGLAAVPVLVTLGIVIDAPRGEGFPAEVGLGNEVHPAALLQVLIPGLFGSLSSPVESWWGGRFFTKGFPYFLSLYVGPLVLALALAGAGGGDRRRRWVLLGTGALGLWYALGAWGGLAPAFSRVPFTSWFRFPSKAMLLPYLAAVVLAGIGVERLRRGQGWSAFRNGSLVLGGIALGVASAVGLWPVPIADWAGIDRDRLPATFASVRFEALAAALIGIAGAGLGTAVSRGALRPSRAAAVLAALVVLDLARTGAGMNPQTTPAFFDPVPELAAERLHELDGGRVFSYGPDQSPAFRRFLRAGGPRLGLASFFINRQLLAPYTNLLDRVETPEGKELTASVPRRPELAPEDYDPPAAGRLVPWLRNAAVSRVLSLDPLESSELSLRATVPLGPPGLSIHVYELEDPWPRAYLACRVVRAGSAAEALRAPYAEGFDPRRDVALEAPGAASCREGRARRLEGDAGGARYDVDSDGGGYLVARDSFARGWTAAVDGRPAPVLRANGKHQAIFVPAGSHEVVTRYRPPGLVPGLAVSAASMAAAALAWRRRNPEAA